MDDTIYLLVTVTAKHGDAELQQDMKDAVIDTLTDFQGSGSTVSVRIGT